MITNKINVNSEISLPIIGFGAAPLGGLYGKVEDATIVVKMAMDQGVNYFDTSPYYGNSEIVLGKCLEGIPRNRYYISTKCGRINDNTFDYSAANIRKSLTTSLTRLGTTYIDIFLLHDIEFGNLEEIMNIGVETLLALKKEGGVTQIGFSTYNLDTVHEASKFPLFRYLDVILVYGHNNLFNNSLSTIKPILDRYDIGLIDASPLALGLLTSSGPPDWHPANREQRLLCKTLAEELEASDTFTLPYLALYYTLTNMVGSCLLVGLETTDQLIANLSVISDTVTATEKHKNMVNNKIREVRQQLASLKDLDIS